MGTETCGRCHGEKFVVIDEDDRRFMDACYHCGETGLVDEETAFQDALGSVGMVIGAERARAYRVACDADEEGEGFAFHAAENQLSAWEYEQSLAYVFASRAQGEINEMSREAQEWLVALAAWPVVRAVAPIAPVAAPVAQDDEWATGVSSDDLPF